MIDSLLSDVRAIIDDGVARAYAAVNVLAALTYWRVGRQIHQGDQPTIGLLLCSETGKDLAKYSVLNGNKQLFAAQHGFDSSASRA